MARIYLVLALFALLLLSINLIVGFSMGDYGNLATQFVEENQRFKEKKADLNQTKEQLLEAEQQLAEATKALAPVRQKKEVHVWMGVAAALVTLLVNAVSVTYFIGTNRWCLEVVETYSLDRELAYESARLKRRTFPWSLGGIGAILTIVTLGAAADASANFSNWADWVIPHYLMAICCTLFIGYSFMKQVANIGLNYDIIEKILVQVEELRSQKGLGANLETGSESETA